MYGCAAYSQQGSRLYEPQSHGDHHGMGHYDQRRRLEEIVRGDPDLMGLLTAAHEIGLPQWRVVAGCIYQTAWNVLTKKPARTGIRDYDLIYFDACNLSWEAEDQVVQRVAQHMRNLPA